MSERTIGHGSAAVGLVRPDGPAKLTGAARYAADHSVPGLVFAVLVNATVPRGRLSAVDRSEAVAAPGVVAVLTAADLPRFATPPVPPLAHSLLPMQDDRVAYEGQPVALVAAGTREQAEHAAGLVRPRYTELAPAVAFGAGEVVVPDGCYNLAEPDLAFGDLERRAGRLAGRGSRDLPHRRSASQPDGALGHPRVVGG